MRVGLLTTAIFGNLSGYFFGNFRDKGSNIIWRYAICNMLYAICNGGTIHLTYDMI